MMLLKEKADFALCCSLENTEDESNSKSMTFSTTSYYWLALKTSELPSKKYYL